MTTWCCHKHGVGTSLSPGSFPSITKKRNLGTWSGRQKKTAGSYKSTIQRHSFAMSSQKNMVKSNPDPPAASQYILSSAFDLLYYEMCLSPSYPLRLVLVLLGKTCSYSKHLSPFCDEFFIRDVVLQKFLPEEGIIYNIGRFNTTDVYWLQLVNIS